MFVFIILGRFPFSAVAFFFLFLFFIQNIHSFIGTVSKWRAHTQREQTNRNETPFMPLDKHRFDVPVEQID